MTIVESETDRKVASAKRSRPSDCQSGRHSHSCTRLDPVVRRGRPRAHNTWDPRRARPRPSLPAELTMNDLWMILCGARLCVPLLTYD